MKFFTGLCLCVLFSTAGYCQTKPSVPTSREISAEKARANKGNVTSMYTMGCYYYYGVGVAKNYLTASQWLTKAANKNNTEAMLLLADIYDEGGPGIKRDPAKTLSWYKKAASKGNAEAAYELGEIYENGDGVTANMTEAVKWYSIAAEKGDADAMVALGFCYMEGDGVPADRTTGYNWFLKASDAGAIEAMRYLGDYFAQDDMGNDCRKALKWYMKAADAGDTASVKSVGVMIMKDECPDVDKVAIATWMKKLADNNVPEACFYMGGFYITGAGVPKSPKRGMDYLVKEHEIANATAVDRNFSTNNLFTLYNSGDLKEADQQFLLQWFEKTAAKTNDDEMMSVLANIYINKENAAIADYRKGMEWATRSADKGNPGGMFWVGFVYSKGLGDIKKNDAKAFNWVLKAAQKGDTDAMKLLAEFYEYGTGGERNAAKAAEWRAKAEREE